jgi:transcriptional regulator with XRE-family HTH domain
VGSTAILPIMGGAVGSPFGARLRRWRRRRGLSQLALAGLVGSTSRHISFLETGRSRPSRQMTLRLASALDVGLREANALLHAAGLPATYPQAGFDSADLGPYRAAIERMLTAHEPYPGMVLDGHWNVILANHACAALFGTDLVGVNFVRDALANPATAGMIENWTEVAWAGLDRLRGRLDRNPLDEELQKLVTEAEDALYGVRRPPTEAGVMVCPIFRIGGQLVRTIAMIARFDQAAEITLDELSVELMYPFDDAAERFFRSHASGSPGGR